MNLKGIPSETWGVLNKSVGPRGKSKGIRCTKNARSLTGCFSTTTNHNFCCIGIQNLINLRRVSEPSDSPLPLGRSLLFEVPRSEEGVQTKMQCS